jgi:hypothetical protein
MRGLDPRIPLRGGLSLPKRDRRDKPGDDEESQAIEGDQFYRQASTETVAVPR